MRLAIPYYTVANRLRTIYEKLHVTNRTQAALYALRQGGPRWTSRRGKRSAPSVFLACLPLPSFATSLQIIVVKLLPYVDQFLSIAVRGTGIR